MPAPSPSKFVAEATGRGFVFSVKSDGSLGVRPPAPGAMTDPMRRYITAMKGELLALLSPRKALPLMDAARQDAIPLVAPALQLPSGRMAHDVNVLVRGIADNNLCQQQYDVPLSPALVEANRLDWDFLVRWWSAQFQIMSSTERPQ